jgi:transposase-like protein
MSRYVNKAPGSRGCDAISSTNERAVGQARSEAFPGIGQRSVQGGELARLKRELQRVKEEREILKKAAVKVIRSSPTKFCNTRGPK